jgi:putative endonuclease
MPTFAKPPPSSLFHYLDIHIWLKGEAMETGAKAALDSGDAAVRAKSQATARDLSGDFTTGDLNDISQRQMGGLGERLAVQYLKERGYEVLERNWQCPFGEADIIARDPSDKAIVFVEVKTRFKGRDDARMMPEVAVNKQKQKRYSNISTFYFKSHPEMKASRFDIIAVNIIRKGLAHIHHILWAFEGC